MDGSLCQLRAHDIELCHPIYVVCDLYWFWGGVSTVNDGAEEMVSCSMCRKEQM